MRCGRVKTQCLETVRLKMAGHRDYRHWQSCLVQQLHLELSSTFRIHIHYDALRRSNDATTSYASTFRRLSIVLRHT